MTTIYHREYYDRLFLTIEGHSNFGNYGEDIVCAGISTLAYTLLNCMLDEESAGNIKLIRNIVRDGYICLEIEHFDFSKARVKGIFDACITGLLMLEEGYPQHIRFQ